MLRPWWNLSLPPRYKMEIIIEDEKLIVDRHMKEESERRHSTRPTVRKSSLMMPSEGPMLMWRCSWMYLLRHCDTFTPWMPATEPGQGKPTSCWKDRDYLGVYRGGYSLACIPTDFINSRRGFPRACGCFPQPYSKSAHTQPSRIDGRG